jgi:hypothetical protein
MKGRSASPAIRGDFSQLGPERDEPSRISI